MCKLASLLSWALIASCFLAQILSFRWPQKSELVWATEPWTPQYTSLSFFSSFKFPKCMSGPWYQLYFPAHLLLAQTIFFHYRSKYNFVSWPRFSQVSNVFQHQWALLLSLISTVKSRAGTSLLCSMSTAWGGVSGDWAVFEIKDFQLLQWHGMGGRSWGTSFMEGFQNQSSYFLFWHLF